MTFFAATKKVVDTGPPAFAKRRLRLSSGA